MAAFSFCASGSARACFVGSPDTPGFAEWKLFLQARLPTKGCLVQPLSKTPEHQSAILEKIPMRILLVEDEAFLRELLAEGLKDFGFTVAQAASGSGALLHFRENRPDVLLTDIRLPGRLDGWDLAERFREEAPDLPVIYVTGFPYVPMRPVPNSHFARKPIRLPDIVALIRHPPWRLLRPEMPRRAGGEC
jgi:hypothetical protein